MKNKNKLFLLKTKVGWHHDEYDSFMIIASSSQQAREIAQKNGGTETSGGRGEIPYWTDPKKTSCRIFNVGKRKPGIVISSYNSG